MGKEFLSRLPISTVCRVTEKEPPDSLPIPIVCHTLDVAEQLQPDQLFLEIEDLSQAQQPTELSSQQHSAAHRTQQSAALSSQQSSAEDPFRTSIQHIARNKLGQKYTVVRTRKRKDMNICLIHFYKRWMYNILCNNWSCQR